MSEYACYVTFYAAVAPRQGQSSPSPSSNMRSSILGMMLLLASSQAFMVHRPSKSAMKAWLSKPLSAVGVSQESVDPMSAIVSTRGGGGNVVEVRTLAETEEQLEKAGDKLVVMDFTATWCGPCRMIAPHFESMSESMGDLAVFLKVDVDVNADTAKMFEVFQMPTFVFVKEGKVVARLVGANPEKLREAIHRHL